MLIKHFVLDRKGEKEEEGSETSVPNGWITSGYPIQSTFLMDGGLAFYLIH
jgi:hypothetical protein